jgi:LysM repeat protein/outer membrane biosynthesis protein TonB
MHLVHLRRRFASRSMGLTLGFALISMLVAGCFQAAGAALEPTATGQVAPAVPATETLSAPTEPPTPLPVETTEVPTEAPTIGSEPSNTQPTVEPTQAPAPTELPTEIPTEAPIPTEVPTEVPPAVTDTPPVVAQAETPTPGQPFGGGPEASQTAALATIFAQATQILVEATQTAAVDQTMTATAQGTFVPGQPGQPGVDVTPATLAPGAPVGGATATAQGTPGAPGSGAAGPVTGDCVYTVAEGDRLYRIALRFGLTPAQLIRANGIVNADLIVPGQKLRIPNCNGTPTAPAITPTVTRTGTTSAPTPASGSSGQIYVVQEGDTLFGIATRFHVRVMALAQANGITNINLIYIGQRLVIP